MYIATKPCKFAGQSFVIGEAIPNEFIHSSAVDRLKRVGIIAESNTEHVVGDNKMISVPVIAKEGTLEIELTNEDLQSYFLVAQSNAEEAKEIIAEITNSDLLLVIHALDSRKGIKAVAQEKAMSLI